MDNNIDDTILSKLQKLYNLWSRNTEGAENEALAAKRVLDKHLEKYGITLEDFLKKEEKISEFKIKYSSEEEKKIIIQCVAYLFGTLSNEWKNFYRYKNGKMEIFIKTSKPKFVLLEDFINFHLNNWRKEIEKLKINLYYSYLKEHKLWDKDEDKNSNKKQQTNKLNEIIDLFVVSNLQNELSKGNHYQGKINKNHLMLEEK